MEPLTGAAVVGQSGGPSSAINATLSGVIRQVLSYKDSGPVTRLYGMKNGFQGLSGGHLIDLSDFFSDSAEKKLSILRQTPAAALGSCRMKLPDPSLDKPFYEKIVRFFAEMDIRYFFYIGGNDSMDTVAKLSRYLKESGSYEMRCVGIPKTIDNDLQGLDHTPGYGSAAKFVAVTVKEIVRDCSVYTTPAVTVIEIMGRDAGWLTASSALPCLDESGPDLIYLPERPFSVESFLDDIRNIQKQKSYVVAAVSEGLKFPDGRYVGEGKQSGSTDVFGHRYLAGTAKVLEQVVKENIGCKVRSIELSLPQRCACHVASAKDLDESGEIGAYAVRTAVSGKTGVMITNVRDSIRGSYSISLSSEDVDIAAGAIKTVPEEFINEAGNFVTEACLEYMLPLIQGEVDTVYEHGLPVHLVF
ncbi:MAG: 6-phosphofructokinase [Clostridia bacterium]|nr:6-phosphofructokinase [Clostridia bacterium]